MGEMFPTEGPAASTLPFRVSSLVRVFCTASLLLIPLHAGLACITLLGTALLYGRSLPGDGMWSSMGPWAVASTYAILGFLGGSFAGAAAATARTMAVFEDGLRAWIQQLPVTQSDNTFPTIPVHELRAQYEETLDQILANTVGRFRLPALLHRFVRSRLRQAILEDFIADCEHRGLTLVGFSELCHWLAAKGLPLAMNPIYAQLWLWRLLLLGGLGVLGVLALTLAFLNW